MERYKSKWYTYNYSTYNKLFSYLCTIKTKKRKYETLQSQNPISL
jgi:hypothetical protein